MRVAPMITLTEGERVELTKLVRSGRTSVRLAQRARIILLAADGKQSIVIAAGLGIGRLQVARWRQRYVERRLAGIERDLPRDARRADQTASVAVVAGVLRLRAQGRNQRPGRESVSGLYFCAEAASTL